MDIKVDVLDYLGIHEDGVLSILSLNINDEHYECIFYYGESMIALTPDPKFEEKSGVTIEEWEFYNDVVIEILKRVVPYEKIKNQLTEFNPADYNIYKVNPDDDKTS